MIRIFTAIFLIGWTGFFATQAQLQALDDPGEPTQPNILFILTDDHRWDVLGCAGHPFVQTPHIDRLAETGTRFTNAFVTTSICAASRASYLTGMYERTHKFTFGTPPISQAICRDSYPALLKRSGYQSGFVGKFGVQVQAGSREEMFDYFRPVGRSPYLKKTTDGRDRHASQIIGDLAIEFLDQQTDQQPFCLSVSFNAPHAEDGDRVDPFPSPAVVDGMYEDVQMPKPTHDEPGDFESHPEFLKTSLNRQRWYWRWDSPERYERNLRGYFRMISGIDHVVGRLMERLAERQLAENTVIVFAGDNGYYLGSRGFAGKWSHYDESLRIPLIIYDPRQPRNAQKVDQLVLNIDVPSTIASLAGVNAPETWQGQSLTGLIDSGSGVDPWREDFFCEHLMHYPRGIPKWEGVRSRNWMYARYFEQQPVFECLYDLQKDPGQKVNLADQPGFQAELESRRRRCDQLREQWGGAYSKQAFPTSRRDRGTGDRRPEGRPNIVMIVSDGHAWNDYSFLGHPVVRTRHIDRLANHSATFPRGYVPSSLCRPSLASMLTGRYPSQHRITGNDPAIPPELIGNARQSEDYLRLCEGVISQIETYPTLARVLSENGYASLQTGKWWEGNFARGGFTAGMTHGDPALGGRHGDQGLTIGRSGLQPIFDFVDDVDDQPFLIWYAPFLPHTPHDPPERLLQKYQQNGRPPALARYFAMVEWFDETCGQLLEFLDERNLARNTIVVYLADNGWIQMTDQTVAPEGWNKSFAPRSKQSPYEGGVRTPIMIRWPAAIDPAIYYQAVSSIDLMPTLLAATGIEAPDSLPGRNLLDTIWDQTELAGSVFGEIYAHDMPNLDDVNESLLYRWCIDGRWKLIKTYPGRTGRYGNLHPQTQRTVELYDLYADPHESVDVADDYPAVVERLTRQLDQN